MSEGEIPGSRDAVARFGIETYSAPVLSFPVAPKRVSFDRLELQTILNVYGRKVSEGEWRDYAIDFLTDKAVFSIYRRSSEVPLYRRREGPASCPKARRLLGGRGERPDPQARQRARQPSCGSSTSPCGSSAADDAFPSLEFRDGNPRGRRPVPGPSGLCISTLASQRPCL